MWRRCGEWIFGAGLRTAGGGEGCIFAGMENTCQISQKISDIGDITDISRIVGENRRRNEILNAVVYDPESGRGCEGPRRDADFCGGRAMLPVEMLTDPEYNAALHAGEQRCLRLRHDFEYWALKCVTIRDKMSGEDIPLRLNAPQRRLLAAFERQRRRGLPIRTIILKARQWGGSTLVQTYMAWIQITRKRNWHSFICAHVKDTAATIRGMYTKLLQHYPKDLWEGDEAPAFRPFERSQNTREIAGRGCRVTIGSSENQDSSRGNDISMAHLSEVAFWKDSRLRSPDELVRAAVSGIPLAPMTFIAMESTANGVGSYFHNEWLRAEAGKSDKTPVFVPWYEIEIYRLPVDDPEALWASLDDYERRLWTDFGLTLEMIHWYHVKRSEMSDHQLMMAEYPTTAAEAFANTGAGVFTSAAVEALRAGCRQPSERGDMAGLTTTGPDALTAVRFIASPDGLMKVWQRPVRRASYVVSVDVGGRSAASDYSVIAVIRRDCPRPEVVAQWRGHTDHDLLSWKAAQVATWYNGALLVVESNTLESGSAEPSVVLDQLGMSYANLYMRAASDDAAVTGRPCGVRPGFHTNVRTKAAVIAQLIADVRDGAYTERDNEACNELLTYEQLPGGGYAARRGRHDDILMTRAIALHIIAREEPDTDFGDDPLPPLPPLW